MAAGGGGVSGGAGVVNLSLQDDALGIGNIFNSLFCGADKKCRREKNRTPDAPDIYNFTFGGGDKSGSSGISTPLIVVLVLAAGAVAVILLTMKTKK